MPEDWIKAFWEYIIRSFGFDLGLRIKDLIEVFGGIIIGMIIGAIILIKLVGDLRLSEKLKDTNIVAMRVEKGKRREVHVRSGERGVNTFMRTLEAVLAVVVVKLTRKPVTFSNMPRIRRVFWIVAVLVILFTYFCMWSGQVTLTPKDMLK